MFGFLQNYINNRKLYNTLIRNIYVWYDNGLTTINVRFATEKIIILQVHFIDKTK